MKGFSIIVCCYNSAKLLPETLEHLAALCLPVTQKVELLVIDNCCTDDTAQVASDLWKKLGTPFKMTIAKEETPGLSAAREKGIKLAQYDYLLFCDDDNHLNGDYLLKAEQLLSLHPQIGVLGGYGEPVYDYYPSFWHKDFFIYGSGPQAKKNGKIKYVHGAGVIIRKEAFNRLKDVGFTFILSDRKKERLTSGGDYELCYAITLAGYDVWYDADLKFLHYIAPERTNWAYCKRFIEESAPALDVLQVYHYIIAHGENKTSLADFYLKQLKSWLFHLKHYLLGAYKKYQYRQTEDVYFLEKFHQKFHKERICCMCSSVFSYKRTYNRITTLKKDLKRPV